MRKEGGLAYLTAEEMAEADRIAIDEVGIDVMSLMENAGVAIARVARSMTGGSVSGRKVCLLVGKGNNGGDALVSARHLRNWGADAQVVLSGERAELREVPARQLNALTRMGIPVGGLEMPLQGAELLVDGLLGYGSRGNPRESVAELIRRANSSGVPILAVDLPSGLDATTGEPGDPCIVAKATVTFGLPKTGFLNPASRRFVGELHLADISFPEQVYRRFMLEEGIFTGDSPLKIG